jgi:class 3 adenylate cyclase
VAPLGLKLRAGVHTGEVERLDGKVGGIAVHIGARIAHEAAPGEVLVSSTVKDLVVGSGLRFRERGRTELKGVPGEWQLYAVEPGG